MPNGLPNSERAVPIRENGCGGGSGVGGLLPVDGEPPGGRARLKWHIPIYMSS
jgi:hypothetical protein